MAMSSGSPDSFAKLWFRMILRMLPGGLIENSCTLGFGRRVKAPGTWGSVAGIIAFSLFLWNASSWGILFWGILFTALAVAFTGERERRTGEKDPGYVILDEFVAIPFCFLGWNSFLTTSPYPWVGILLAFGFFRLFDILKPLGIGRLQHLPGGWGVVLDDIAAGLATAICMNALLLGLALGGIL